MVRIRWLFRRYGRLLVLIGRALPTIRTIISLPAGVARMELRGFLLFSTMGTAIWSTGLATAGFVLGSQFSDVERIVGPVATIMLLAIIFAYVWRQVRWQIAARAQMRA